MGLAAVDTFSELEGGKVLNGVEECDDGHEELPFWEQARCLGQVCDEMR